MRVRSLRNVCSRDMFIRVRSIICEVTDENNFLIHSRYKHDTYVLEPCSPCSIHNNTLRVCLTTHLCRLFSLQFTYSLCPQQIYSRYRRSSGVLHYTHLRVLTLNFRKETESLCNFKLLTSLPVLLEMHPNTVHLIFKDI